VFWIAFEGHTNPFRPALVWSEKQRKRTADWFLFPPKMHVDYSRLQTSLYAFTGKNSNRVVTVVYPCTQLPFSILRAISCSVKVKPQAQSGWVVVFTA